MALDPKARSAMPRSSSQVTNHQAVKRETQEHKTLALDAAKEALRVLPLFESEHPRDDRPRKAIEAIQAWAKGTRELGMKEVRRLSLDSHAAAREATSDAARLAARAAGHAVATWHVPRHASGAHIYAQKAIAASQKPPSRKAAKPKLLAGGNPQIAKGDGDAPVQAYIEAMPGWKRDVGRRLDAIIVRTVHGVRKAVQWNSPLYGVERPALDSPHDASHDRCEPRVSPSETRRIKSQGWFLGIHCFTKYVKVAFFRGTSLRPTPPGKSKQKEVRYLDIHEDDPLDETQFADWVRQASQLPGERTAGRLVVEHRVF